MQNLLRSDRGSAGLGAMQRPEGVCKRVHKSLVCPSPTFVLKVVRIQANLNAEPSQIGPRVRGVGRNAEARRGLQKGSQILGLPLPNFCVESCSHSSQSECRTFSDRTEGPRGWAQCRGPKGFAKGFTNPWFAPPQLLC